MSCQPSHNRHACDYATMDNTYSLILALTDESQVCDDGASGIMVEQSVPTLGEDEARPRSSLVPESRMSWTWSRCGVVENSGPKTANPETLGTPDSADPPIPAELAGAVAMVAVPVQLVSARLAVSATWALAMEERSGSNISSTGSRAECH